MDWVDVNWLQAETAAVSPRVQSEGEEDPFRAARSFELSRTSELDSPQLSMALDDPPTMAADSWVDTFVLMSTSALTLPGSMTNPA